MKRQLLKIDHLKKIQNAIFAMTLTGDCSEISAPGQFINIKLDGFYLRRPISIYSFGPDFLHHLQGGGRRDESAGRDAER